MFPTPCNSSIADTVWKTLDSLTVKVLWQSRKRRGPLSGASNELQESPVNVVAVREMSSLDVAKAGRRSIVAKVLKVQGMLEELTETTRKCKDLLVTLEEKEGNLVDEQMELRAHAKVAGNAGDVVKKLEYNTAAREKNRESLELASAIAMTYLKIASNGDEERRLKSQMEELQAELGVINAKIDELILDGSTIKPKQIFPKLPCLPQVLRF